jgi:hypothetical protein
VRPVFRYLESVVHHRAALALCLLALSVSLSAPALFADEDCARVDHEGEWESRHGRAPSAENEDELRALFERPTAIEAVAERTDEAGARIETRTETHAVYPVDAAALMETLTDDETLVGFMPNLGEHEILCEFPDNVERQRQRTDFGLRVFRLGTEYIIDVQYLRDSPDTHASRWVLVDSVDGRMAYIYGSWYFESVTLDGAEATYVRHYARTGLTTRVPGVRLFVDRRLEREITNLFTVLYEEAARRFGRTALR